MAELILSEPPPPGQIDLRCGPEAFAAIAGVLGCEPPAEANTTRSAGQVTMLWLGPDEWLVLVPGGEETALIGRLRAALAGQHAAVTDVSGARMLLRLSGPNAREVMMKGCTIDLHPRAFGPGRCAQTLLARAGILFHQTDDQPTYDLLPRRSFTPYMRAWLGDAMAEYGGRMVGRG